jgi:hypothetical protein
LLHSWCSTSFVKKRGMKFVFFIINAPNIFQKTSPSSVVSLQEPKDLYNLFVRFGSLKVYGYRWMIGLKLVLKYLEFCSLQ